MEKSTFSEDYILFLSLLKSERKKAGLTQEQIAEQLGQTQSFVSKCERGERRIDIIELMAFCKAMHVSFEDFAQKLQSKLKQGKC